MVSDSAMYLASVLDRAIVACFFVIQEIGPLVRKKINLEVE
jgi:hypothetical protein